jgi:hypothetical protein
MNFGIILEQENPWTYEHGQWVRRCLAGAQHASTRGHRCLPALAEEDEQLEVEPEVCSPENERLWRGGATAVENSCRASARVREEAQKQGGRAVVARGSARLI